MRTDTVAERMRFSVVMSLAALVCVVVVMGFDFLLVFVGLLPITAQFGGPVSLVAWAAASAVAAAALVGPREGRVMASVKIGAATVFGLCIPPFLTRSGLVSFPTSAHSRHDPMVLLSVLSLCGTLAAFVGAWWALGVPSGKNRVSEPRRLVRSQGEGTIDMDSEVIGPRVREFLARFRPADVTGGHALLYGGKPERTAGFVPSHEVLDRCLGEYGELVALAAERDSFLLLRFDVMEASELVLALLNRALDAGIAVPSDPRVSGLIRRAEPTLRHMVERMHGSGNDALKRLVAVADVLERGGRR